MEVVEIIVSIVDPNLAISLEPAPGFGKLGTVTLRTPNGDNELIPVYYSGGFFKRESNLAKLPKITEEIMLLTNIDPRRKALRVNYVTAIRNQLERLKLDKMDTDTEMATHSTCHE